MKTSVEAFVTPELIRWARMRSSELTDSIARKVNVKSDTLTAWEMGEAHPSLHQAQKLARALKVPFGYLYLPSPPQENLPLPDLRQVAGTPARPPSPDFLDVLHDSLRKQQWYREYLEEQDAPPVPFVGRFNLGDDPKVIATAITSALGVGESFRLQAKTWEQFLTDFIRKAEEASVLVLRSSIVGSNTHRPLNVQEFRGFAISDNLAPLVFINSADAKAAQIFTLAHELAHIWVGQSGVSNPNYIGRSNDQENAIDRLCDSVAAEVLAPSEGFIERWNDFSALEHNLNSLAAQYKVSAFVVLRRAYELGKVEPNVFRAAYDTLLESQRRGGADGGGNFYLLTLSRNSSNFTTALMVAIAEGRVPPSEAASLLNVRIATLVGIEKHILGSESVSA